VHSRARLFHDRNGFWSRNLLNCSRARPKASFTLGHDLRPKARKQNSATESRRSPSSLGKCQGYLKEVWLLRWVTTLVRSFGSNRWVKAGRGQLWSDQNPSWTQLRFLTTTVWSHARNVSTRFTFICTWIKCFIVAHWGRDLWNGHFQHQRIIQVNHSSIIPPITKRSCLT